MAETGAQAVKLEGGARIAETVAHLVAHGIPVMGHVGLTPQSVNAFGGYRVQGRGADADRVAADARAVAEAGAFAVVLEKVPEPLGTRITAEIAVPTIGIGAGAGCDGQILVVDDILGIFEDFRPKFVKRYADLGRAADAAIAAYADEVRARRLPRAPSTPSESPRDPPSSAGSPTCASSSPAGSAPARRWRWCRPWARCTTATSASSSGRRPRATGWS